MIKSLNIQNFQSHEKTQLSFHEGVNVIVGSSDSGKTAVIRALRWVVWNRPSGDHIRSSWGGDTSVSVGTEDGAVIRSKGKQDSYQIRSEDKNLDFRAFGTNVPDEVQKFFNISEINLQGQLDAPFLLSETPGAVAAHFNKVAKLDKIDSSTQKVNSAIRKLDSDIAYAEKDIAAQTELLTKYEHLEKFEIDVETLEELEGQANGKRNAIEQLRRLIRNISKVKADIIEREVDPEYEKLIEQLLKYYKEEKEKATALHTLYALVYRINSVKEKIKEHTLVIASAPLTDKLIGLFAQVRQQRSDVKALHRIKDNLYTIKKQIVRSQENAVTLEEQFHKEMPDVCPLCDQPIQK